MSGLEVPNGGGLGALWAWFRGSNDSLSSAGSARTTGSFVFQIGTPLTSARSPPAPSFFRRRSSDTLTLHRKYGLIRDPLDATHNRCSVADPIAIRDRRAASECLQRRSVHVPGKRRAPPPPILVPVTLPRSSHRRHGRKRPAPQPPTVTDTETDTDYEAFLNTSHYRYSLSQFPGTLPDLCKFDKTTVKNEEIKYRPRKNFLKKIFESRKRNSTIQTDPVKILPSIRELDIQAVEIIEARKKMKQMNSKNFASGASTSQIGDSGENEWFCTKCHKYIASNSICFYCQPGNSRESKYPNFAKCKDDDKEKLRKILKEMKDSLHKDAKYEHSTQTTKNMLTEAPTLRIGTEKNFKKQEDQKNKLQMRNVTTSELLSIDDVLISQAVVLHDSQRKVEGTAESKQKHIDEASNEPRLSETPLKISSLLSPMFVKKNYESQSLHPSRNNISKVDTTTTPTAVNTNTTVQIIQDKTELTNLQKSQEIIQTLNQSINKIQQSTSQTKDSGAAVGNNIKENTAHVDINKYSRRRQLINQLEKSIAEGDEVSAADAAVKLAQLRLSCSVLSFPTQLVNHNIKPITEHNQDLLNLNVNEILNDHGIKPKVVATVQNPMEEVNKGQPVNVPSTSNVKKLYQKPAKAVSDKLSSTTKNLDQNKNDEDVSIQVWVEDKVTTRGPIKLFIQRKSTLRELKTKAEAAFGLAAALQRWIVGQTLCTNDETSLVSLAGVNFTAPFYLCLVHPDNSVVPSTSTSIEEQKNQSQDNTCGSEVYSELVLLEKRPIVSNTEAFECGVCLEDCKPGEGVILRECVHSFCKMCLTDFIRHCEDAVVPCPATACDGVIQEREIRCLVTAEDYEKWLARGLAAAESGTKNAFHCRTRDCTGWAYFEPDVRRFPCPVCKFINCIPCQAIHVGETCEEHQQKLRRATDLANADPALIDESTNSLIKSLITKGEAIECPECKTVITKKWGCDWVKCSACKTEICWVTKGRRWGPAGKGDTSAGCKCGVDGKRCHPTCGYCH